MEWLKHFEREFKPPYWNTRERIAAIEEQMDTLDFNGKRVLDLGCRFGIFSYLSLAKGAAFVTGIDFEKGYIKKANEYMEASGCDNFCFRRGNLFRDQFWKEKPDIILCLGVIYHTQMQLRLLDRIRKANCPVFLEGMVVTSKSKLPTVTCTQGSHIGPFVPNSPMYELMFQRIGFEFSDPIFEVNRVMYHLKPVEGDSVYCAKEESHCKKFKSP